MAASFVSDLALQEETRQLRDFQAYDHGEATMIAFSIAGVAGIIWMLTGLAAVGWLYYENGRPKAVLATACSIISFLVSYTAAMMAVGWAMDGSDRDTMVGFCVGGSALIVVMLTGLALVSSAYLEMNKGLFTITLLSFVLSFFVALTGFIGGVGFAVQDDPKAEMIVWCVGGVGLILACLLGLSVTGWYYQKQPMKTEDSKSMTMDQAPPPVAASTSPQKPQPQPSTPSPAPAPAAASSSSNGATNGNHPPAQEQQQQQPPQQPEEDDFKIML